ncbi:MAG: lytic transglycosylase domain-containing protein [Clostridia bacterium]|nr:lytic transglycosylase domain-containing protein [Clostridia bacterium]
MRKKILVIFAISVVVLFLFSILVLNIFVPKKYKNYVFEYSNEFGLDSNLVYSIIKVESDFETNAVSKSGALGLMQLLPKTARWIAEELNEDYSKEKMFEPEVNIRYGCFYLKYLFDKFKTPEIVICAYNAGEGKVLEWIDEGNLDRDEIDYEETRNYLAKVERFYRIYNNKLINV